MDTIFMESNENLGILIDSYEDIYKTTDKFLDKVSNEIAKFNDDPEHVKLDLNEDIKKFKEDIKVDKKPSPIEVSKIKSQINRIKKFQEDLENTLKKYIKTKDKIAYGGNVIRGIIAKPKVYIKDATDDNYEVINNNIRNVNRAMDWIEKTLIDLFNLADQDMNILYLVNKIYVKPHIFESVPAGVIYEDDATLVGMLPGAGNPKFVKEASFDNNTRDKKTSHVPAYIGNKHDMASYGEEEPEEKEKSLEDYRRPSAPKKEEEEPEKNEDEIKPYQEPEEAPEISKPVATPASPNHTDVTTPEGKAIQNYYYYTYNNSMNKHDNHSVHTQDDHSQHNSNNGYHSSKKEDEFHSVESANPWDLDIGLPKVITEGRICMNDFFNSLFGDDYNYKKEDGNEMDVVTLTDPLNVEPAEEPKRIQFKDLPEDKKRFIMDLFSEAAGRNPKIVKVDQQAQKVLEKLIADKIKSGTVKTIKLDDLPEWDDETEEKTESTIDKDTIKKMVRDKVNKGETLSLKELEAIDDEIRIIRDDNRKPNEPMKIIIFDEAKEEPTGSDKPTAGDADDMKPKSDHPIKDAFMDIDRKSTKLQQGAKKAVQDTQNVVRAAVKPIKRTQDWIGSMVAKWKDANETNIKEKMADPMARKGLFNAFKKAIEVGALFKAGILLNPIFLFLTITKKIGNKKNEYRIRNEMISELKTEMDIIDEKIKDAGEKGDNKAKYELKRFKNEINKKLLRVAGADSNWAKKVI